MMLFGNPRALMLLNNRPRKCLRFKVPYEAFELATEIDVKRINAILRGLFLILSDCFFQGHFQCAGGRAGSVHCIKGVSPRATAARCPGMAPIFIRT